MRHSDDLDTDAVDADGPDQDAPDTEALDVIEAPPMPPPLEPKRWVAMKPAFSIRSVIGEAFSRYAADPLRLIAVVTIPQIVIFVLPTGSGNNFLTSLIGAFGAASAMVLVDARPAHRSLVSAMRQALGRLPRILITDIVVGILVSIPLILYVLVALAMIGGGLLAPAVTITILTVLLVAWIATRLLLAAVAVTLDGMRVNPALDASRALTREAGVSARIIATLLTVGVLTIPSVGLVFLPYLQAIPESLAGALGAVAFSLLAPIWPITLVVLYRQLAGNQSPSAATSIDEAAPSGSEDTSGPGVVANQLRGEVREPSTRKGMGRLARAMLGAAIAMSAVGGVVGGVSAVRSVSGDGVVGSVPRGEVEFGSSMDLSACSITGRSSTFSSADTIAYVATFSHATDETDVITVELRLDGTLVGSADESFDSDADCVGSDVVLTALPHGNFEMTFLVNGELSARGSFSVR